ncbi:MAG: hypothetical protein K9W42_10725 [Candidatus Heimdallarchaeota archaeon]|nr:hypothetical protein [Candidatus Heimdallarchaeota archaeon]
MVSKFIGQKEFEISSCDRIGGGAEAHIFKFVDDSKTLAAKYNISNPNHEYIIKSFIRPDAYARWDVIRNRLLRTKFPIPNSIKRSFPIDFGTFTQNGEKHPATLTRYIVGENLDNNFFLREIQLHSEFYVDGTSIPKIPPKELQKQRYDWVMEFLKGVIYLGSGRVIHTDLFPPNIRFENKKEIVIMDISGAGVWDIKTNSWRLIPLSLGNEGIPGFVRYSDEGNYDEFKLPYMDYRTCWWDGYQMIFFLLFGVTPFEITDKLNFEGLWKFLEKTNFSEKEWPCSYKNVKDVTSASKDQWEKFRASIPEKIRKLFFNTLCEGYKDKNKRKPLSELQIAIYIFRNELQNR